MTEVYGYIAAILIGIAIGMVGSGGSILTVPVLVYLMHMDALQATTSSLFIVGITSFTGGIRAHARKLVDFKAVTEFGIPSIFSVFITRHYLLPALPPQLFSIGGFTVSKGMFLMVVFALLMLMASISLMRSRAEEASGPDAETGRHNKTIWLILLGLGIGVITGLLGAGGGFLIIPSLVLFLRLPMKTAVGTSLLLVAINSLFGFLFSLKLFEYNWTILLSFTVLAVAGLFIGSKLAERISATSLKKGFGWFILVMGVYILVKEIFLR